MNSLIALAIIATSATFYSHIFRKKIEETIVFSVLSIILILYICGILSILPIGWYLISLINIIYFIFLLFNHQRINIKLITSFGLIFIITTTITSLIIHKYRIVTTFDEFNFWFIAVKNTYLNDELFTSNRSNVLLKDYMPASTIFHYFWLKPSPSFDESSVFVSMNFFISSLIGQCMSLFKRNQWKHALIAGFFILMIPITLYDYIYTGTYVDGLMGLIFAYILFVYFIKRTDIFNIFAIVFALSVLTLTKTTGIIFSMSAVIIIIIDKLLCFKYKNL